MTKRSLLSIRALGICGLSAASLALSVALLVACATDNGDALHGPQFGPPPDRPDGSAEGSVTAADGSLAADAGAEGGADPDAASPPTCTGGGTVAVLAGTDSTLSGAVQIDGAAWAASAIAAGGARSAPSLVAFGTGFLGLTRGPSDALQSVSYGASWSGATAVGALTTLGTPAVSVLGASAQGAYLSAGADLNKFSRIENTGASWSTSADPIKGPLVADAQAYGPTAGALAAGGTDLVFAQAGSDHGLYVQIRSGGAWSSATAIIGAGTYAEAVPPALVATSGKFDLVVLYAELAGAHSIGFATRDATTKLWSTAQIAQATAQTSEPMSAARISPSSVLVTFRGNDQRPYWMTGTLGAAAITWSLPAPSR